MSPGQNGTWVYNSTQTYVVDAGGGTYLSATQRSRGGKLTSVSVVVYKKPSYKRGPNPAPVKKSGTLRTIVLGKVAGIAYGLDKVSDLANPFCWVDDGFCSATEDTKKQYDEWSEGAGADTDSDLYKAAEANGEQAPLLALGGGRFAEGEYEVVAAGEIDVAGLKMSKSVERHKWDLVGASKATPRGGPEPYGFPAADEAPFLDKRGSFARPFMNSSHGQLLREIMQGSAPRLDSRGFPGVVEWRTPGAARRDLGAQYQRAY